MAETKDDPTPPPPADRLVPVTIRLPPRAYDACCRQAGQKQQSLSAFLRTVLLKNTLPHP